MQQLPGSVVSCGAAYSPSQEARGRVDAWLSWHRLHTDISVCVYKTRMLELLPRRAWCIASSQAPKHRMVQPVRPHRRQGDTWMHDLGSTVRTQASLCGCTSLERANRLMLHFAAYVMHYSRSWAALHRVAQPIHPLRRQGARRCVACLAQIAHRHFLVRAIDPKV